MRTSRAAAIATACVLVAPLLTAAPAAADAVRWSHLDGRDSGKIASGLSSSVAGSNLKRTGDLTPESWWGNDSSWNRYAYVENAPTILADPDGQNPVWVGGLIGAIAGAFAGGYQEIQSVRAGYYHSPTQVARNVGASVLGGAVTGAAAAKLGPKTILGGIAVGGGTAVLGGGVRRLIDDPASGQDFSDPVAAATDLVAGSVGGGIAVGAERAASIGLKPLLSQKELEGALISRGVRQATGGSATGSAALAASQQAAIGTLNDIPVATGAVLGESASQIAARTVHGSNEED